MTIARTAVGTIALWAVFTGVTGCGGDPDWFIDGRSVTDLPPGNATGTAFSGTYDIEGIKVSCAGRCNQTSTSPPAPICRVGGTVLGTQDILQKEGVLVFQGPPSALRGGINVDGTFDVGGQYLYGNVYLFSYYQRIRGVISSAGTIVMKIKTRTHGHFESFIDDIDCLSTSLLFGKRR